MTGLSYEDYSRHDAIGLAALIRRGEISAKDAVEAALARIETVNGSINAITYCDSIRALQAAAAPLSEGPFAGVPFLIKELDAGVAGFPRTMSCKALRHHVADTDSEIVKRYRKAGVILIGSTNAPELGLLATTEPELYGPTRNPWNPDYSSGGSSGGAAAAVAAGIVPMAHGGDGGGSIRIPAAACGLFGLKPTRGRMPLGPDMSDGWSGLVVPHVISRSVRDSAAMLDATHGPDTGAPYTAPAFDEPVLQSMNRPPRRLRIAFTAQSVLGEATHPDCDMACRDAAALVASLGHDVEEIRLDIDAAGARLAYLVVVAACTAMATDLIAAIVDRTPRPAMFEPETWFMRQIGRAFSASDYEDARYTIGMLSRHIGRLFETFDVLLTPTVAYPTPRLGELSLKATERMGLALIRHGAPKALLRHELLTLSAGMIEKTPNTMLFNMTGQPAMSVPLWWNESGLPVGSQFAGRFGDEATLFQLAGQLEQARPWAQRMAPI